MRVLVVMKRFSSGKDQIGENFGREVRLASELRRLGHKVTLLCADHVKKERISTSLDGMKVEIYPFGLLDVFKFLTAAKRMGDDNDVIFGTSHPLLGHIAHLAAKNGKPMVYDVRDNYDYYDFSNVPLLKKGPIPKLVNNHVLRSSSLVTCASPSLAEMVKKIRKGKGPVVVLPNGVDLNICRPVPKEKCRRLLGLPVHGKIITYSGGIRGVGVDLLIAAFRKLQGTLQRAQKTYGIKLMLIGDEIKKRYSPVAAASNSKIIVLGSMPYEKLLYCLNASDAFVIAYEENEFTKVMYTPYKLMDYMALNKPIVCTDVGEMRRMLKGHEQLICKPNDTEDMAAKIAAALRVGKVNYRKMLADFTWQRLGRKLNTAIRATFKNEQAEQYEQ